MDLRNDLNVKVILAEKEARQTMECSFDPLGYQIMEEDRKMREELDRLKPYLTKKNQDLMRDAHFYIVMLTCIKGDILTKHIDSLRSKIMARTRRMLKEIDEAFDSGDEERIAKVQKKVGQFINKMEEIKNQYK